jgi:hypothetical protein
MKKSFSSPCLTGLNNRVSPCATAQNAPKMRKSISTNAFPMDIPILEAISNEMQIEAVIHVSGLQAGSCAISNAKFPYELLSKFQRETPLLPEEKALTECLLEPCEKEEPPKRLWQRPITLSYLDLSETDPRINQRYAEYLRRIRKNRKGN